MDDGTFPALLKTLSDSSEEVPFISINFHLLLSLIFR
jgi:hypothetical protein